VAWTSTRPVVSLLAFNLAPAALFHVVAPEIAEFIVIVVLPTENPHFVVAASSWHRCANRRSNIVFSGSVFAIYFLILAREVKDIVAAGSLNKATENHEAFSVFFLCQSVIIAG
jgi:hypothetical protein